MNGIRWLSVLVLTAAPAAYAAEQLNIRPGTWELTTTTQMRGNPLSKAQREQLTPQQRADMEAAFRSAAQEKSEPETDRDCITAEEIASSFRGDEFGGDCKPEKTSVSGDALEIRYVCTGERAGSGVMRVRAHDPRSISGQFEMNTGQGADLFEIKMQMTGRWVSDECEEEEDDDYGVDEDLDDPDDENLPADEFDEPEDEEAP